MRFCKDNDLSDEDIPTVQKFGRVMWGATLGFEKKKAKQGIVYKVFGVTEPDFKNQILISEMRSEEEHSEGFIQPDD